MESLGHGTRLRHHLTSNRTGPGGGGPGRGRQAGPVAGRTGRARDDGGASHGGGGGVLAARAVLRQVLRCPSRSGEELCVCVCCVRWGPRSGGMQGVGVRCHLGGWCCARNM